ncbi:MAG: hypothetical protein HON94_14860 [Methylococcales bacterium]|jgi:hypothetical protein|nr:hypothetical protein [Methylococcales bacterium]MBT7409792.1 hypothetical protein [Methylococcales bacterium]
MSETVDDLTVTYTDNGIETIKELNKEVLTKGAWATVMYRYQDWDRKKEEYGADKYTIRRYQKRDGKYTQKSKFNISSKDQAKSVISTLQKWIDL